MFITESNKCENSPPAPISISEGNLFSGAQNTRGGKNLRFFTESAVLSWKWCEIGPWLLLNAYWKSYALYRMMIFSMTFTDPYPSFQGHGIFYVEYLKSFFDPWLTDKSYY